ncbi:type VI secretion system baseplate subunit TssF [uncultured Shewanella sp.]|uniref:type VI secretion system baseplate subunit TssF n=1 Tax=uncultured Shewanella sp. TaxID=173975 RepID=UPI00261E32F1|nr:type VI secretion system baseplate subunit TssF [uncultured Shewanella sp.]
MHHRFLYFFEQELMYLKSDVSKFASSYPELARNLNIHGSNIEDPDISRLIESIALLNARVNNKIDDDYPKLVRQLLRMLFPQSVCPIPSYAIVEFSIGDASNSIEFIPKGSLFRINDDKMETAFSTCYDVELYPIELISVDVFDAPFNEYKPNKAYLSQSLMRLTLRSFESEVPIFNLLGDSLIFYLDGEIQDAYRLYDVLFSSVDCIVLSTDTLEEGIEISKESIKPYNIENELDILPYPVKGYGALSAINEFFNYTDKYRFISIDISSLKNKLRHESEFSLYIYCKNIPLSVSRFLNVSSFKLNCVPLVNLYPLEAEPLRISGKNLRNKIITDVLDRNIHTFCVDEIMDISSGKGELVTALYEDKYYDSKSEIHYILEQDVDIIGEFYNLITLVGNEGKNIDDRERVLSIKVKAMMGEDVSLISTMSKITSLSAITLSFSPDLLTKPSASIMNVLNDNVSWDLLQHLNLNLSVIFGSDSPLIELKRMLSIYNRKDKARNETWINSIVSLNMERVVSPARINNKSCYVQGSRIDVEINSDELTSGGVFILIHLLDYFFSWFCSFNSFTQLDIYLVGISGTYYSCPRRMGWRAGC